ncbi:hypothetical protein [Alcanivorax sp.]|uniref:hypothetical protein n=1 Tax=Alcanivorax sp. TaxID=1872427 RepID=UPI0026124B18|nr:hypothetical protein [Alcanivorax sp.]
MDEELKFMGIKFACIQAQKGGFKIEAVNNDLSLIPDAVLSREGIIYHLFVCTSVYPESPIFTENEIQGYYSHAESNKAVALGCSLVLFNPDAKNQEELSDLSNGVSTKVAKMGIIGPLAKTNPFLDRGN